MRIRAQDLGLQVLLEARHDPERGDQSRDPDRHAGDRDQRVEGNGSIATFRAEIAEADEHFVGELHVIFPDGVAGTG